MAYTLTELRLENLSNDDIGELFSIEQGMGAGATNLDIGAHAVEAKQTHGHC